MSISSRSHVNEMAAVGVVTHLITSEIQHDWKVNSNFPKQTTKFMWLQIYAVIWFLFFILPYLLLIFLFPLCTAQLHVWAWLYLVFSMHAVYILVSVLVQLSWARFFIEKDKRNKIVNGDILSAPLSQMKTCSAKLRLCWLVLLCCSHRDEDGDCLQASSCPPQIFSVTIELYPQWHWFWPKFLP